MMKRFFVSIIMVFACFATMMAQQAKIGFFSYQQALKAMPEYATAVAGLENLRKQYAAELKSAEDEFNDKYELFLDQQAKLADPIRQKRQADLQEFFDRNTAFRKESDRLLKQAEQDAMAPLKTKLQNAIAEVGNEKKYLMIVNTDSEACPYIDAANSEDVTEAIMAKIK